MTTVSMPNSGARPRRRAFDPGSLGGVALVLAVWAAIAGGIIIANDDAPTATATVTPSADTFTKAREATVTQPTTNSADTAHFNRKPAATTHSADRAHLNRSPVVTTVGGLGQVE